MKPFCSLLIVALLGVSIRASADSASVVILRTGTEPACLDVDELAKAVTRHATLPVRAVRQVANARDVVVSARDDRGKLVVTIRGDQVDVTQTFVMPSCDTMTDVIAAFVASTVKPLPQLASAQPSAGELAAAVLAELEQAGFRVREHGMSVAVAQDQTAEWMVVIAGPGDCVRRRTFGELPVERDAAIARAVAVAAKLIAGAADCEHFTRRAPRARVTARREPLASARRCSTSGPVHELATCTEMSPTSSCGANLGSCPAVQRSRGTPCSRSYAKYGELVLPRPFDQPRAEPGAEAVEAVPRAHDAAQHQC